MGFFASGGNSSARFSKLPDGTLIQRGVATMTKGGINITLPTAFDSANYVAFGMDSDPTVGSGGLIAGAPLSASVLHLHGLD